MTETEKNCIEQALRFLALREHNHCELKQKLQRKGYDNQSIAKTLAFLEEDGSLSEQRYVKAFVRSSNSRHPEGKSMMLRRLAAKGADRNISREIVESIYNVDYIKRLVEDATAKIIKKGKAENLKYELHKSGFSDADIRIAQEN